MQLHMCICWFYIIYRLNHLSSRLPFSVWNWIKCSIFILLYSEQKGEEAFRWTFYNIIALHKYLISSSPKCAYVLRFPWCSNNSKASIKIQLKMDIIHLSTVLWKKSKLINNNNNIFRYLLLESRESTNIYYI